MIEVTCLKVGEMGTNCYLVSDSETSNTLIIDPGDEFDFISTTILEKKLSPKAILLTHGHSDHLSAATELKLIFNLPIYLHPKDLFLVKKTLKFTPQPLEDGQVFKLGSSSLEVLHTPGHTPGSCSFLASNVKSKMYNDKYLFTGDTLFATDPGTADRPYSSPSDLKKSLASLKGRCEMYNVKCKISIFPGHEAFNLSLDFRTGWFFIGQIEPEPV